jgi:hypothetical protein
MSTIKLRLKLDLLLAEELQKIEFAVQVQFKGRASVVNLAESTDYDRET